MQPSKGGVGRDFCIPGEKMCFIEQLAVGISELVDLTIGVERAVDGELVRKCFENADCQRIITVEQLAAITSGITQILIQFL